MSVTPERLEEAQTDTSPAAEVARSATFARSARRRILGGGRRTVRDYLPAFVILCIIAGVWELGTRVFGIPDYVLPPLDQIFRTLGNDWSSTLSSAVWTTTEEVIFGFLVSVVAAFLIGLLIHVSRTARKALYPLLIASQAVPIVVVAPVLAIIFGYTLTPKLIVVALLCFFPIVVNFIDGLSAVDNELLKVMRTLYGTRWSTFRRVEFPGAMPSTFSGLRVAATYAPIGAVFGEYAGSQNGLGYLMIQAIPQLETDLVFAAIFILTAESIILFLAVSLLERVVCPWTREGTRRSS